MSQEVTIAIVGRPNVGKSTLFNRIIKKRLSIVCEEEGVTRDRLYERVEFFGTPLCVIDTGGIDPKNELPFAELVRQQAMVAVNEADVIIMVADGAVGPTHADKELANILLRSDKPVVLAVNKMDAMESRLNIHDFYELGIEKIVGITASHGGQVAELFEEAIASVAPEALEMPKEKDNSIKIALIGRPNVGKSTFFNQLINQERSIVSDIAGTTRDNIDVKVSVDGTDYTFIDTAGIKRKQKEADVVEKFAHIRTQRAIERADICLLLLDANQGMTHQEKKLANLIEEEGKACIIFFNKWDLVQEHRMEHCEQAFYLENDFLKHCPIVFGSAKHKRNLDKVFPLIETVMGSLNKRIPTGELNRFIEKLIQINHPPMIQGKRLRIYYTTQVSQNPPTIALFINDKKRLHSSYLKYIMNQLRQQYSFTGAPLKIALRPKLERKGRGAKHEEKFAEAWES